jgi:competence protein ComEC
MTHENWQKRLILYCVLICITVLITIYTWQQTYAPFQNATYLQVSFLDVGQGDAILVTTPDGVQVLIDGGSGGAVVRELAKVLPRYDRSLDMVVATHFDKDHIGGLIDVLARYEVANIIRTHNEHDTGIARVFLEAVEHENAFEYQAIAGQVYLLGASTTLTIFSPAGDVRNHESNAASVVAKIQYGETAFFLTGDAPIGIEEYLVRAYGMYLKSQVLKLGHHGSRTSTSPLFVAAVAPDFAVVSAGKNNSYGHPHDEVVKTIQEAGVELLNTAEQGMITIHSDGVQVWVE